MPIAAVLPAIIGAAGTGIAAGVQAHAAGRAADIQEQSGQQALALQRDVLRQQQQNSAPFRDVGVASLNRLNTMLGGSDVQTLPQPYGQVPSPQMLPYSNRDMTTGVPLSMITVIAPNGERMDRPASEAQHWQGLGAQILQQSGQQMAKPRVLPSGHMGSASLNALRGRVQ